MERNRASLVGKIKGVINNAINPTYDPGRRAVVGALVATAVLAACGQLPPTPAPLPDMPDGDRQKLLDGLQYSPSPFKDIESGLAMHDLEVVDTFGANGQPEWRVISFKNLNSLVPQPIDGSNSANDPENLIQSEIGGVVNQFDQALLFQSRRDGSEAWTTVDLPGVIVQAEGVIKTVDPVNSLNQNAKLIAAEFDPATTPNAAAQATDSVKGWLQSEGANLQQIPDTISAQSLFNLFLANYYSPQALGTVDATTGQINFQDYKRKIELLYDFSKKTGIEHAVFLPKLSSDAKTAKDIFLKSFKEIPPKPKIYSVVINDPVAGPINKFMVIHDPNSPGKLYNYDAPWLGIAESLSREQVKPANFWRKLDATEASFVGSRVGGTANSNPVEMYELDQSQIDYLVVPNKFVGEGIFTIAAGLTYNDPQTGDASVMTFRETIEDVLFPTQIQVNGSIKNWISTVPKLTDFWNKGVREVGGLATEPPKEVLARFLKGYLGDQYDLGLNLFLMPDNPNLMAIWAAMGMDNVLKDSFDPNTIMAVSLTNLPMYIIKGENIGSLGKVVGFKDSFSVNEFAPQGEKVYLEAGATLPIAEINTMQGDDGETWILFRVKRDDNGNVFNQIRNNLVVDKINSALAIKLSDALKGGIMPLDWDNNIAKAIGDIAKIALISAAAIGTVVFPEVTGGLVTATGVAIQDSLLEVFSSFWATIFAF